MSKKERKGLLLIKNNLLSLLLVCSFIVLGSVIAGNVIVSDGDLEVDNDLDVGDLLYVDSANSMVGIGTSAPANLLHIKDTANVDIKLETSNTNGQAGFRLVNDAREWRVHVANDDDLNFRDVTSGSNPLRIEVGSPSDSVFIDSSGSVGIGTDSPTDDLDVNGDTIRLRNSRAPQSSTDTCDQGEIVWDANNIYVCVTTDSWKSAALNTF